MILVAQNDHPHILEWLTKAANDGGNFVKHFAQAALVADPDNYPLLRPAVWMMYRKFAKYRPTEAVVLELIEITTPWESENGYKP